MAYLGNRPDLLITIYSVTLGLDDWEVKIADFVPSTAKLATRQVFCWGKMRKRFVMPQIELKVCGEQGYVAGIGV